MSAEGLAGGCHCGRIRFAVPLSALLGTGYCHCSICRRLSGGPVNAWVAVDPQALRVEGDPRRYRSSATGTRAFCDDCGGQLWFAPDDGSFITLNATGFDDPEAHAVRPTLHVYEADRLCWFDIADKLPRHAGGSQPD
ncbi:hypothetical protein FHS79_002235 [Polymorphobacter multimanifer]|uniref:CENP-V/GFA domain-containing protein n=1 Tax=Polymorphobacter multimanifer TaxID=1070431 RepID=A0A841L6K1_9SPHN|nr:GFA family protein [Polymorphobacter multimanifer]MBB6228050.1 hypothetical protein [Polymorphobacter multimanifer]